MHTESGSWKLALIAVAWAAVVAWALAIFTLSSQPGDPVEGSGTLRFGAQKAAHFVVFALLAVGIANALTVSGVRSRRFWWTFVLCAAYAVSDELHQVLVPFRNPSVFDVFIDMAGSTAGYLGFGRLSTVGIPMNALRSGAARQQVARTTGDVHIEGRAR
jgi:uncharacterized protein YfiM (DUF2279 family)